MGYVGQENSCQMTCLKVKLPLSSKHLSRFYLAQPLTLGVFFSTSPIEGKLLKVTTRSNIFHLTFVAYSKILAEKCKKDHTCPFSE